MLLYLVRHAIAFGRDPAAWPDDRDRPLKPPKGARPVFFSERLVVLRLRR